jgi:hypothetical protein
MIEKMWYIYTAVKKNKIILFVGKKMEIKNIVLRKVSQVQ